ncbi:MAG: hypothetical protein KDE27_09685 [Planctomycetes bacterium]|nr:hypothetical protein [Planctomycetota bacterium]
MSHILTSSTPILLVAALLPVAPSAAQIGVSWSLVAPSHSPPPRGYLGMAANPSSAQTVVFGGFSSAGILGDTWVWDGVDWAPRSSTSVTPPARYRHGMAYDAATSQVLMFGGYGLVGPFLRDTWLWDGTNWQQVTPPTSPSERADFMIAGDLARQRVVLFGGYRTLGGYLGDTWEWDGSTWTQASPATSPSARADGAMAYDVAHLQSVLFGGYRGNNTYEQDTWVWNGITWMQEAPAHVPDRRSGFGFAYDLARNVTVMSGGIYGTGFPVDTWEWDGVDWNLMTPLRPLSSLFNHEVVFDSARNLQVAFGGYRGGSLQETSEYGAYTVAPSFMAYGSGCPGSAGLPLVRRNPYSSPWLGENWQLEVQNVPTGGLPVLAIGLDQVSQPIPGVAGCSQLSSAEVAVLLVASGGVASWNQVMPADPALAGASLYYQAAVLNAGAANPLGLAVSAGGHAVFGTWW